VNAPGSKAETADIEKALAFGHGPRDLIVMIIEDR
jgi:L-lactate utilization protein LutC